MDVAQGIQLAGFPGPIRMVLGHGLLDFEGGSPRYVFITTIATQENPMKLFH